MEAGSTDQSGSYVFEVTPRPQVESASRTLCFWSIEGDNDSMITVWNYKLTAQDMVLTLYYSGGQYRIPFHLEARRAYNLDMLSLVRSRAADPDGSLIPDNITSGSAMLSGPGGEADKISVAVAASVFNVRNATCGQECVTCNGASETGFDPTSYAMPVQGSQNAQFQITWNSGTVYTNPSGTAWHMQNTTIATVNGTGTITGQSPGQTLATAVTQSYPIYATVCSEGNAAPCPQAPLEGGGNANVGPLIESISPSTISVGSSGVQVTISGFGFGNSPTLNLPSGVTASKQNSQDAQVTVTLAASYSTAIGNAVISLTANGVQSNSEQVTLDGPFQMVVGGDSIGYYNGTSGNVIRKVTYQIQNFSKTNASTTTICEAPTKMNSNCSPSIPDPSAAWSPGVAGHPSDPFIASGGAFIDQWSLGTASYTPTGCGYASNDPWSWDPQDPQLSELHELGLASGYLHTDAISIDGVTSTISQPNKIPNGTVMPK